LDLGLDILVRQLSKQYLRNVTLYIALSRVLADVGCAQAKTTLRICCLTTCDNALIYLIFVEMHHII